LTKPGSLDASTPGPLGHRQILIAFSGLVLAMLLAALDSTIVSTALPTIVSELGGLEHLAYTHFAEVPAQFMDARSNCGVIALWTKNF
jgi:MFS family permease